MHEPIEMHAFQVITHQARRRCPHFTQATGVHDTSHVSETNARKVMHLWCLTVSSSAGILELHLQARLHAVHDSNTPMPVTHTHHDDSEREEHTHSDE
jgi:hypothetical protein